HVTGFFFFFSSRRRHTRFDCDWSSDVCSSDLTYFAWRATPSGGAASGGTPRRWEPVTSRAERLRVNQFHPHWKRTRTRFSNSIRSEERRVGKECRSLWPPECWRDKRECEGIAA